MHRLNVAYDAASTLQDERKKQRQQHWERCSGRYGVAQKKKQSICTTNVAHNAMRRYAYAVSC